MNPPTRLGRYEIVNRVGRGGMGTVYLAHDPRLNRTVALKALAEFSDSEVHERFLREARAVASLRHHNIVTVYDIGEDEGQPFIAMEYVDGETLAAFISRKPAVPLDRKLQIATELCTALLYAHRAGIIHRDVKPGNIMLAEDGSVKILDFGLARWVVDANSLGLTQTGTLMGSPHYMSPEQISGQPVDQRSDIFAVGAVFYELLTYQKAFPGESMATVLHRIMSADPTPVRAISADLEPELEAIIGRALQKAPDDRYPTLQEMLQDLGRVVRLRLTASDDHAVPEVAASSSSSLGVSAVEPPELPRVEASGESRGDRFESAEQVVNPVAVRVDHEPDRPSVTAPGRRGLWLAGAAVAATLVVVAVGQLIQPDPPSQVGENSPNPPVTTEPILESPAGRTSAAGDTTPAPGATSPGASPVQLVERARSAYREGRLRPALDLALDALKLDPGSKEAQAFLAELRGDARRATVAEREAATRSGAESTSADYVAAANAEKLAERMGDPADTERVIEQYRAARERYQAAGRTAESTRKTAAARTAEIDSVLARVDDYIAAHNFAAATVLVDQELKHDASNPRLLQTREKIENAERTWRVREAEQENRDIQALLARAEALSDPQQRESVLMDAQAKYPKSSDIRAALTRTREAMKRPPPVATAAASINRDEIVRAVREYAEAFESLSAERFRAIYPNATPSRLQGLARQRNACRKPQVTFDEKGLTYTRTDDGRVLVNVSVAYGCAQSVAGRPPPPATTAELMTLRQAAGRWLIEAMAER